MFRPAALPNNDAEKPAKLNPARPVASLSPQTWTVCCTLHLLQTWTCWPFGNNPSHFHRRAALPVGASMTLGLVLRRCKGAMIGTESSVPERIASAAAKPS